MARPEERKFLGFRISNDGSRAADRRRRPSQKFKERVRELTCRTRGVSLPQLIDALARYLIGWRGYFGFCQTPRVLLEPGRLDPSATAHVHLAAVEERAEPLLRTATPGVPEFHAAVAAGSPTGYWRMAGHAAVQQALRNALLRLDRPSSLGWHLPNA